MLTLTTSVLLEDHNDAYTLLFHKNNGHGSGCTTALINLMHCYLYCAYCLTCLPPCAVTTYKTCTDHEINILASRPFHNTQSDAMRFDYKPQYVLLKSMLTVPMNSELLGEVDEEGDDSASTTKSSAQSKYDN